MSFIAVNFLGRLGNQMFTYAFARAYAEKHGLELQADSWVGQKIFEIDDMPISNPNAPRRDENNLVDGENNIIFRSYCQNQKCAIYTLSQVRKWFKFRPGIENILKDIIPFPDLIAGHRRVGDYPGTGFPVVSMVSYNRACGKFGLAPDDLKMVTEENPITNPNFRHEMACVPDFYRLMVADVIFRGNSTFSWWAATLGRGRIFAPIVKGVGLVGGKECDVEFVEGNHPACSDFDFVTDIHLKP